MVQDPLRQSEHHVALHERLLRRDDIAAEAIVIELLPLLERSLRRSFRTMPRDAVVDAAVDALLEYITRPHRFDPERGVPLHLYLRLAAARNLQDTRRREVPRLVRERQYAEELARRPPPPAMVAPPQQPFGHPPFHLCPL